MPFNLTRPGKKAHFLKVIKRIGALNDLKRFLPDVQEYKCTCIPEGYNKFVVGSQSPSARLSSNMLIGQLLTLPKAGKLQFGNTYLGKTVNLNYLGRTEGMPGGSGTPPFNRF
jgi:hypothetical protein